MQTIGRTSVGTARKDNWQKVVSLSRKIEISWQNTS